jgi:hypothetical protein
MRLFRGVGLVALGAAIGSAISLSASASGAAHDQTAARLRLGRVWTNEAGAFQFMLDTRTGTCYLLSPAQTGATAITQSPREACD